jgi:hypothetical protein
MSPILKQAFEAEMAAASHLYKNQRLDQAFKHLETAHVLAQRHLIPHVRAHWAMLQVGLKRRSTREVLGQAVRIVLGAVGSAAGTVPIGNTGGTNIGMFKRLPVSPEIERLINKNV